MQFRAILKVLAGARVEFIVIGGVGAVLHGAPIMTRDLDVVHGRGLENRRRIVELFATLRACYREQLPERFVPTVDELASPLTHMLDTEFGDLDLLGTTAGLDYEDLLPFAPELELEPGLRVRVLALSRIIELKEGAGRPKDLVHLPFLRETLAEQRKRDS